MSDVSKKDCEVEKGIYAIEITTTQACNFRCSYCFERDFNPSTNLLKSDVIIQQIRTLLNDKWFKKEYEGLKIVLWGGEPTLNFKLCEDLINEFMNDKRVCFFIYTNGSTIEKLLPYLILTKTQKFIKKDIDKFTVQVSYDGNPVNDLCRLTKNGEKSSELVLNAIEKLHENKIEFGLKSTLSLENFKHLSNVWEDIHNLYDKFGDKISYALTVDYFDVKFEKYKEEVENALLDIAAKEYKFFRKHRRFLSNIFRSNRAICSTGKSMATIDTNGDVYYCHGCIYSENKNSFKYSNIYLDTFVRDLENKNVEFGDIYIEPEECKNCIASMCLRCNVKKYDYSDKKEFREKWFDYTSQTELCDYYKMTGKIGAALRSLISKPGGK